MLSRSASSTPKLPRLPVPDLRKTLNKYLTSVEPFLLEDELRGGMSFNSAYALRKKWADEFESGIGAVLQERLVALDRFSPNNWLDDNFWIDKAYLEWRAPLLVNSNWWLAFHEDSMIPQSAVKGETNNNRVGTTFWQVRRAAWLIHRMLDFKEKLDTQELHPETTRTGIWLRGSTSKLFNIARRPKRLGDTLSTPPGSPTLQARSLLLMVHDWCYRVTVYHPPTSSSPVLMSPKEIEARIRAVILDVEDRLARGERAFPIGVLSGDNRDCWADNLEYLLNKFPTNETTYDAMLHSVMGLSLDHTTYTFKPSSPDGSSLPTHATHTRAAAQSQLDAHLHTIRSTHLNVSNRFFDKALTLIVDPSTRAGATGEHSPCDALVPSIVAEYAIVEGVDPDAFQGTTVTIGTGDEAPWERLDWVADEHMWEQARASEQRAQKILDDSDDSVLWFEGYGTDWIKDIANLSPDAFIQMALQLVWYKTRGEFTATYETVLTRMFKHGRTETLRTFTRESRDWVLSMLDPRASRMQRYKCLQAAITTHARLTREAATGRGIDRHLLGLRLLMRPINGEHSPFFEDELFERSARWKLSTSGLSAGHLFKGTGFGAVYDDGYGINYLAAPAMIKFGIESKFSSTLTSTQRFKEVVVEVLDEMHLVCLEENVADIITSHL
ncbi:hypothetical protein K443DRAFT_47 [Laccaria amethystina LaAM-08-1]|uniref:Choline/carnitine acyltransferase domain-containing protein n=1 Tax=Laccaria amethystina LaAM-08-1 TaxID=1095629 RepID=A0A0C9XCT5_9AGAR|nr:hypothetical protein K443DRAFT_47 [Laccaria amethystina LaAM-08-1]